VSYKGFLNILIASALLFCVTPVRAQSSDNEPTAERGSAEPKTDPSKADPAKPDKRLFGVLPNYRTADGSVPFSPISSKQKLSIATHDSFDWPTYVTAGFLTAVTPGSNSKAYGTGLESFANRYARWSADQIIGNMLTEGFLPVALHQDPRFFRAGTGSFSSRFFGAISQIVIAKNDSGHRTFNTSEFLGNAMATGISNAYSPNLNSWSQRSEKFMLMIGSDTFSNVVKEFGPDIRQHLPHRHKNS
jgi:hypothetical protein